MNFFPFKKLFAVVGMCNQKKKMKEGKELILAVMMQKNEEKKTKMYMYYPIYSVYYSEVSQI